jgi:RNA polymerase sigma-70 factor, ECF subfamily
MLGSVQDAEDVLQEAFVRVWQGLGRFEGRSSLRVWMYRVVTNACLTALRSRARRVLPLGVVGPTDPGAEGDPVELDVPWLEPYPVPEGVDGVRGAPDARYEQRESVELAFVAALQHLAPNERAVLLLREVVGFSAREIAAQLDTTTAAVTSALQRARQRVEGRLPSPSQQEVRRMLGDAGVRALVARYMDAMARADVTAVVTLLTDDATWSMPPLPSWYRGRADIAAFLERYPLTERWRHVPTTVNAQAAVAGYRWDEEAGAFVGWVVDVLTLRGDRIAAVTGFLGLGHVMRLGLPERLD